MKKIILSTLLHYANGDIPFLAKEPFYAIKKKILEKHGKVIDTQYQRIVKECYRCDGTGTFWPEYRPKEPCWYCRKGIYEEFVTFLHLYKFGKYEFHVPFNKIYIRKEGDLPDVKFIEGYIRHKTPKFHIGYECALWLLLFYNFKAFRKVMISSRLLAPRTPLVALKSIIFFFRYQLSNNVHRTLRKLKTKPKQQAYLFEDDELPF